MTNLDEQIRIRAYELGERNNFRGDPSVYWLEAEREIRGTAAPLDGERSLEAGAQTQTADICAASIGADPFRALKLRKGRAEPVWSIIRLASRALQNTWRPLKRKAAGATAALN